MVISVVVPCYNEEDVIEETYNRLYKVCEENSYNYELIFINDGSRDRTLELLSTMAAENNRVKVLSFSRNFGHQAAVSAGLRHCDGDVAIIIDADLQDPPELFPEMLKIYSEERCNVVYAVRKSREKESFFKKFTAKMFYRMVNYLSEVSFPVDTGDFRLVDRKVIDTFNNLKEKNKYIRGIMSWIGFKQRPIYYDRSARFSGETKYTFSKMLKLALTGIFYFSTKPLRIASSLGLFSIFISLGLLTYTVLSMLFGGSSVIRGWSSTLITIIFFGGIQLFMIGILGEYIGNIFEEIKGRPEFIIERAFNIETEEKSNVK